MNVYFEWIDKFEFTPELSVFDAFSLYLYHGWVIDPQDAATYNIIKNTSYNQLLTKLIQCKNSDSSESQRDEGQIIENFLEETASQLTFAGLLALHESIKSHQPCVFFRNNHFSTMLKHNGKLYTLVTDMGYINETTVVWELLDDIAGL